MALVLVSTAWPFNAYSDNLYDCYVGGSIGRSEMKDLPGLAEIRNAVAEVVNISNAKYFPGGKHDDTDTGWKVMAGH